MAAGSTRRAPCGEDRCWSGVPAGTSSVAPPCSLDCSTVALHTGKNSGAPAEDEVTEDETIARLHEDSVCAESQHSD